MIGCGWCAVSIKAPEGDDNEDDDEKLPEIVVQKGKSAMPARPAAAVQPTNVNASTDNQFLLNRDTRDINASEEI